MKDLRTIILAAGKGTRMKSDLAKVLHRVCGRPIIQYVLDVAKTVGSLKTYIVLGHKGDSIEEDLGENYTYVTQPKLQGTADAVRCCEKHIKSYKGDVLILCGDTPLLNKEGVKMLVKKHKKAKAACTFLTAVVHDPSGYGRILRDDKASVVAIREDKDAVGLERDIAEINVGVYCFKVPTMLQALKEIKVNQKKKEFYLTDIIEILTTQGLKVETVEIEDSKEGLGVNTQEDLAVAQDVIRRRILSDFMIEGVNIVDPSTTYINSNVKIGKDTTIQPYSFIEENVRIGNKCSIGPFARLRPGTRIGNSVEIGNFTEVSRTKIGNKTTIKHFSYLGDSFLGNKVNVGAGVVTANFDGESKNQTRIADSAFIGSDAVLVAPVKLGKNSVVGAGSVVPRGKNVPDNCLAVGTPAKVISKGKRK